MIPLTRFQRAQRAICQPLADLKSVLEFAQRPVVGVAGVPEEQRLLIGRRLQCNAMRLLHDCSPVGT